MITSKRVTIDIIDIPLDWMELIEVTLKPIISVLNHADGPQAVMTILDLEATDEQEQTR